MSDADDHFSTALIAWKSRENADDLLLGWNLAYYIYIQSYGAEMFGYIGTLRTMTSGRGQFSMEFSHYAACPKNVADEVIAEVKKREEEKNK